MDSFTQILLGASVGHAALGHRVGRKAALWGGICGLLPDLDVVIPFASDVAAFTYHRSFSHSLFVLAALTPLMVWLIRRVHGRTVSGRGAWARLVYLAFATHVLLDCLTVYGTQIFWPLDATPVAWASLFIIDPLYSLPLLVGVVVVLRGRGNPRRAYRMNAILLGLSTLYAAWGFGAGRLVQGLAEESLAHQDIRSHKVLTVASPFNTLLWRVVAMKEDGYYEGWYSLLDDCREVEFTHHRSEPSLLAGLEDRWSVQRLQWFTRGFYAVAREGDAVVMTDLRMGSSLGYVFRFRVGQVGNPHVQPTAAERLPSRAGTAQLGWVWQRLKGR